MARPQQAMKRFHLTAAVFIALAGLRLWWLTGQTGGILAWDYKIYSAAVETALAGGNPYAPVAIGISFLNHPFLILIAAPFRFLGSAGTWLWTGLLAACWAGTLRFCRRRFSLGAWQLLLLAFLTPAVEGLYTGQVSLAAAFCLAAATDLSMERDRPAAGVYLGLAILLKASIAPVMLALLVFRRWTGVLAVVATIALGSALPAWLLHPGILGQYFAASADPAVFLHAGIENHSLAADLQGLPEIFLSAFSLGILILAVFRRMDQAPDSGVFAAFASWGLLFSPLTWHHHYTWLAFPLAGWISGAPALGLALAFAIQADTLVRFTGSGLHLPAAAAIALIGLSLAGKNASGRTESKT